MPNRVLLRPLRTKPKALLTASPFGIGDFLNELGDVGVDGIDLVIEGARAADKALDNMGPWGERLKPGGLLDWMQGGLDLAGMAPGVGVAPDALNNRVHTKSYAGVTLKI